MYTTSHFLRLIRHQHQRQLMNLLIFFFMSGRAPLFALCLPNKVSISFFSSYSDISCLAQNDNSVIPMDWCEAFKVSTCHGLIYSELSVSIRLQIKLAKFFERYSSTPFQIYACPTSDIFKMVFNLINSYLEFY